MEKADLLYSIYFNNAACDKANLNTMVDKLAGNKYAAPVKVRVYLQTHGNNSTLVVKMPVG
jgi:hypothetical protein